jgi:hypothetical protein
VKDRRNDILKRIAARTVVENRGFDTDCWIWTGPTSGSGRGGGYARMCLNDTTVAVHKVSFTNAYGYIPPGKQIDHRCTNRLCVNPEHLMLVTHKRNQELRAKRAKEKASV